MARRSAMDEVRLPGREESIRAVTIFDAEGRVLRVIPGNEFRRGPVIRRHRLASGRAGGKYSR